MDRVRRRLRDGGIGLGTQAKAIAGRIRKIFWPEIFRACLVPKCQNAKNFAFGQKIL